MVPHSCHHYRMILMVYPSNHGAYTIKQTLRQAQDEVAKLIAQLAFCIKNSSTNARIAGLHGSPKQQATDRGAYRQLQKFVDRCLMGLGVGIDITTVVEIDFQHLNHALMDWMHKTHRQQHQVSFNSKSEPSTSCISMRPSSPWVHSRRTPFSVVPTIYACKIFRHDRPVSFATLRELDVHIFTANRAKSGPCFRVPAAAAEAPVVTDRHHGGSTCQRSPNRYRQRQ